MATTARLTLAARRRTQAGTHPSRRQRQHGMIPAVLYGKKTPPVSLLVDQREFTKFLHARHGEHGILTLQVAQDPKPLEKPVLIKQVQHDPVNGEITHVDFHAIVLSEQLRVKVPVILKGEPVGVKQDRGVLEHFLREVEVECLPTHIPNQIEHEIGSLKIGDAVHVKDLVMPPGARLLTDPEGVIASVITPKEEKVEEVAADAVTEPEVLREKKPDAEGEAAEEGKEGKKEEKAAEKPEKAEKKEKG